MIIEQMEMVRKIVSKFDKLRKINNLPLKYPVNDFQFYVKNNWIISELVIVIAKGDERKAYRDEVMKRKLNE